MLDTVDVHGDVADIPGQPTRPPLAEMSMFSLALEPLNTSVSVPAWPSTMSLPSPGFQTNWSLPSPRSAKSLPHAAGDDVIAVATEQPVCTAAADYGVIAVAAVERGVDETCSER